MKYFIALILCLSLGAEAGTITWIPPIKRIDGAPLAHSEIGNYKVRYKTKDDITAKWTEINTIAGTATSFIFTPVGTFDIQIAVCDTLSNCSIWVPVAQGAAAPQPPAQAIIKQ